MQIKPLPEDKRIKLEEAKAKLGAIRVEEQSEGVSTLDMLRERIKTVSEHIDLGEGARIEVWACPSQQTVDGFIRRDTTMARLDLSKLEDKEKFQDLLFEAVEEITVDPAVTAAYLKEHPEAFSIQDLKTLYNAYLLLLGQRPLRLARMQKFLEK